MPALQANVSQMFPDRGPGMHLPIWDKQAAKWQRYNSRLVRVAEEFSRNFKLRWYQRQIFAAIERFDQICLVASRQIGKSETLLRFAKAFAMWIPEQEIVIASAGDRQAKEILRKINRAVKRSPIKIGLRAENARELEFTNGSRIISIPNNPDTSRGYTPHLLLVDEADFIKDWEDFQAAMFPSGVAVGGKIVCSGTFFGKRQLYKFSEDPEWHGIRLPYTVAVPAGIEQQRHNLSEDRFAQEFDCEPRDTVGTLFPYELISGCANGTEEPLTAPTPGALYFAGWDPAKVKDQSMFYVLELLPDSDGPRVRLAIDYHGKSYPEQARLIAKWHQLLHFFKIKVDETGVGAGPTDFLKEEIGSVVEGKTFSFPTKMAMVTDLRIAFQDKKVQVWASDTILRRELHDLNPDTLKLEGSSPDRAVALGLAWQSYMEIRRGPQLTISNAPSRPTINLQA